MTTDLQHNNVESMKPGIPLMSRVFRELVNRNLTAGIQTINTDLDLNVERFGARVDPLRDPRLWGLAAWRVLYNTLIAEMVVGFAELDYDDGNVNLTITQDNDQEWSILWEQDGVESKRDTDGRFDLTESGVTLSQFMDRLCDTFAILISDVTEDIDENVEIERERGVIYIGINDNDGAGDPDSDPDLTSSGGISSSSSSSSTPAEGCALVWESYWDCDLETPAWSNASPVTPATCGSCSSDDWAYDRCEDNRVYYRKTVCDFNGCTSAGACTHQPSLAKPTIGEPPETADCCTPCSNPITRYGICFSDTSKYVFSVTPASGYGGTLGVYAGEVLITDATPGAGGTHNYDVDLGSGNRLRFRTGSGSGAGGDAALVSAVTFDWTGGSTGAGIGSGNSTADNCQSQLTGSSSSSTAALFTITDNGCCEGASGCQQGSADCDTGDCDDGGGA